MIGIIGAMENEVEVLKNSITDFEKITIAGIVFYRGKINEKSVVITQCGVGKVNATIATTFLVVNFGCKIIINTGIAGGTNLVKTEDVVIGTKHAYYDVDVTQFGYQSGQVPGSPLYFTPNSVLVLETKKALQSLDIDYKCGVILSGDKFVSSKEVFAHMDQEDVLACEMEGAAIAHTCTKLKVEFIVIRYISDIIGAENQINDYAMFENKMAMRSSQICLALVEKIANKFENTHEFN